MIKFKSNTELEVISDYDEKSDTIRDSSYEIFKAGELVDAQIINNEGDFYVNLQFGKDGGIALSVQRACFEIVT